MKDKIIHPWMFKKDEVHTFAWWEKFLTPEECKEIIKDNKAKLKQGRVSGKELINQKIRDSHIYFISPIPKYHWLFQKLSEVILNLNERFFKLELNGLTEGVQFTNYKAQKGKEGFYGKHTDCVFNGIIRKLSISIQLSDPKTYEGGDLLLYPEAEPLKMKKGQGTLVIFPSYTLHEVTPVTKGERNSLVCWVNGPPFK
jgi:PKHD-type hydroxylase